MLTQGYKVLGTHATNCELPVELELLFGVICTLCTQVIVGYMTFYGFKRVTLFYAHQRTKTVELSFYGYGLWLFLHRLSYYCPPTYDAPLLISVLVYLPSGRTPPPSTPTPTPTP
jgi:hypothetical protein